MVLAGTVAADPVTRRILSWDRSTRDDVIRSAGYSPNLVVISPGDALAVSLPQLSGGDSYVFAQPHPHS